MQDVQLPPVALVAAVVILLPTVGCQKGSADQPKSLVRPAFSFNHPSSWTVDEKKDTYDPDHNFFIDASEGAMIHFLVVEPETNPKEAVATMAAEQEKRMKGASRSQFTRWGSFEGVGTQLQGKMLSIYPTTVRVFGFNRSGKTFVITEFMPDDEIEQLSAGYRMIQDSFKVND